MLEAAEREALVADPNSVFSRLLAHRGRGGAGVSLAAGVDPAETAPLPPAPPKQRAFAQAWRIAMTRPGLFVLGMSLYGAFYALPLIPGLIQRQVFDTLSGHHPAGLNVWSLIGALVRRPDRRRWSPSISRSGSSRPSPRCRG